MGEFREVTAEDGRQFEAYQSLPNVVPAPGLVVLAEIFNVNSTIRAVAERYAEAGFITLAPDMFWRFEPGLHMDYNPENSKRGLGYYDRLDRDLALSDIGRCVETLRRSPGCNGKVAVMGFCMGGELALLAGCRLPVDAVVAYYATRTEPHVEELARLAVPTEMHFAALDIHVPLATVAKVRAAVAPSERIAVHVYDGADHAFARNGFPPYQKASAELAEARSLALLNSLKPRG